VSYPSEEPKAAPPVWEGTTVFRHSFEDNESLSLFDQFSGEVWPGGVDGGNCAAFLASGDSLLKVMNSSTLVWARVCFRFEGPVAAGSLGFGYDFTEGGRYFQIVGTGTAPKRANLFYGNYGGGTNCGTIDLDGSWHVVEFHFDMPRGKAQVYLDGSLLLDAGATNAGDAVAFRLRADGATDGALFIDEIVVDSVRQGPPGQPGALTGAKQPSGLVYLDGVPFPIYAGQYFEQDISGFAPRLGTGAPAYSDLSGFQHLVLPSFHHGVGQPEFTGAGQGDENAYLYGARVDTTEPAFTRLANIQAVLATTNHGFTDAEMVGSRIVATQAGQRVVVGISAGTTFQARSVRCLFWHTHGGSLGYREFTTTQGVQGLLWNGQYLFVSLAGARMQKTADFTVWTDVGSDVLPPEDTGPMAVYDEFMWVADRARPILYRAAQVDGSDLEKGEEGSVSAIRIGPGEVPIKSLCAFNGLLYIGREDGLYALRQDQEQVYVQVVETFPRSPTNCLSMTVYNGYLYYAVGRQVFRLGGISSGGGGVKMEVTPGPLSDEYPYAQVEAWQSFASAGKYLWAVGLVRGEPVVFCYNGVGWCAMYDNWLFSATNMPVAGVTAFTPQSEPYIVVARERKYFSRYLDILRSSALCGRDEPSGTYYQRGELWTSWMSFGLPLVPKLFRLVRFDLEKSGLSPTSLCYIVVTAEVDTGQEIRQVRLGTLRQKDSWHLLFPAGTWGYKLRLHLQLVNYTSGHGPAVKKVIIQYLDRPEPVWGYQMALDLSGPSRDESGQSTQYSTQALRDHLRACRAKESYVRFVDLDGNEADVFISSGPRFTVIRGTPVAQVTLMVVKRYVAREMMVSLPTSVS
jgi:hypothetical protein